ncbi:hypothetical protein ACSMXN_04600 [Jatrophihabitans sp. DSM 45814]
MPSVPTSLKVVLGLAATAADEARKLPTTLPTVVAEAPMLAVSTALQASMKVQQHIAALAARGDEVISQIRGTTEEAPAWATFDESPTDDAGEHAPRRAAFDRIDYEAGSHPANESAEGDAHAAPDADTEAQAPAKKAPAKKASSRPRAAKPAPPGTAVAQEAAITAAEINAAALAADEAEATAQDATAHDNTTGDNTAVEKTTDEDTASE